MESTPSAPGSTKPDHSLTPSSPKPSYQARLAKTSCSTRTPATASTTAATPYPDLELTDVRYLSYDEALVLADFDV
ncbi:MAG: hypothetical protein ACRDYA_18960 [Egibacteraceae bacterium]